MLNISFAPQKRLKKHLNFSCCFFAEMLDFSCLSEDRPAFVMPFVVISLCTCHALCIIICDMLLSRPRISRSASRWLHNPVIDTKQGLSTLNKVCQHSTRFVNNRTRLTVSLIPPHPSTFTLPKISQPGSILCSRVCKSWRTVPLP